MPLSDFQPVIGLEVHAQLLTQRRSSAAAPPSSAPRPTRNTCPVCLGMPGVLPVLNREVVEFAVRTGLALGCTHQRRRASVAGRTTSIRTCPRATRSRQYDLPICERGKLDDRHARGRRSASASAASTWRRTRARTCTTRAAGESLVDLNRAGMPLWRSSASRTCARADEAVEYLKALRDVLVYLGRQRRQPGGGLASAATPTCR